MNSTRLLYLGAAALAVVGLGLRVAPLSRPEAGAPAAPVVRSARPVSAPPQVATGEIDSSTADSIIAANIFARARVAPVHANAVHAAASHRAAVAAPHTAAFTLYGTTIGPQGAVALIDDNTPPRGAHVHYMGDVIAGARLVAITDSTVTLDRESGPLVVHLPPSARQTP